MFITLKLSTYIHSEVFLGSVYRGKRVSQTGHFCLGDQVLYRQPVIFRTIYTSPGKHPDIRGLTDLCLILFLESNSRKRSES